MFTKGQWVEHVALRRPMRVQRDQVTETPQRVWCEWAAPGYHLEAFDPGELRLLPETLWRDQL